MIQSAACGLALIELFPRVNGDHSSLDFFCKKVVKLPRAYGDKSETLYNVKGSDIIATDR